MTPRRWLLLAFLLLSAPMQAHAASFRGETRSQMRQFGLAFESYRIAYRRLPDDIRDDKGNALLSWRVALLPFLEDPTLYHEFQLSRPWNDPINKPLIQKRTWQYHSFFFSPDNELSGYVIPRGPQTVWGEGPVPVKWNLQRDPSKAIVLIEVAESHAPVWTEPRDLTVDRADPHKGLGWHWRDRLGGEASCLALFADQRVRRISELIPDEHLWYLFTGEGEEPATWTMPWHTLLLRAPLGWLLGPALLFSLLAAAGVPLLFWRLCRGQAPAPGEGLRFIVGAQQLVFLGLVVAMYEKDLVSDTWYEKDVLAFWLWPRVAGVFAAGIVVFAFDHVEGWDRWSRWMLGLLCLPALDAVAPHQFRVVEESFATLTAPWLMAALAILTVYLTTRIALPEGGLRPCHWLGIAVSLLPLAWFCIWWSAGLTTPRAWFLRGASIRE